MAVQPKDLCTVAEVKSLLNISAVTWDTILQTLITGCSKFIANYCDRDLRSDGNDVTEYYDGYEGEISSIVLKKYPVTSITSVSSRSGSFATPTWFDYSADTDYVCNTLTGELFFNFTLPGGRQNIKVVYKGGYANGAIPEDLNLACMKLVAKEFGRRFVQGVTAEHIGDANVNWNENMDPYFVSLLSSYKNMSI